MAKYPGEKEVENDRRESERRSKQNKAYEEPDFIAGAPNYDKFEGWTAEEVLVFLNID